MLSVTPVAGALGAEIDGVDLRTRMNRDELATVRDALHRYCVLFFSPQTLSAKEIAAFARSMGRIGVYPFVQGMADNPELIEIKKEPHQTSSFGGVWHTDSCYLPDPPDATLLYAVETPPAGGDTLFANQCLSYASLSPGMQTLLDGLRCTNSAALTADQVRGTHLRTGSMTADEAPPAERFRAEHPLIRVHPGSGRSTLYFSPAHTEALAPLTAAESRPLLDYLEGVATQPENSCRFRWQAGSLALWDNRSVLHRAINDYDGHRRVMWRVTIDSFAPI